MIERSLSCATGGFPAIWHNEVGDITAEKLTEICSNVVVEQHLERLTGEFLALRTSISRYEGRHDISANGVWAGRFAKAFFDAQSLRKIYFCPSTKCVQEARKGKKRC